MLRDILYNIFPLILSIFTSREDPLKPEGVKQVWSRDGLLLPKHDDEAALFQSGIRDINDKQVDINSFLPYILVMHL